MDTAYVVFGMCAQVILPKYRNLSLRYKQYVFDVMTYEAMIYDYDS